MKRVLVFIPVLLLPALLVAQTPTKPRRATHVRGEAVGVDNRPVTPATSAGRATGATPALLIVARVRDEASARSALAALEGPVTALFSPAGSAGGQVPELADRVVEHRGGEFGSYLAPGMEDLPQIDTIIIENPSSDGPYGAKGISEMANNPQPPAIAAAVFDAVGVWVTELPISPERVLRALERKERGEAEPRREGKFVIFDQHLSVNTIAHASSQFRFALGG